MSEHLSSNVVNYLIWRYLQESGYGKAALALAHDWNDEPDTLPFADRVQARMLLCMLQDGLWLDDIRAEASNGTAERLYQFGCDHGRPFARYNSNSRRKRIQSSRRVRQEHEEEDSGHAANGARPTHKKQGAHVAYAHINGDMDVDMNGAVQEAEIVASDVGSVVDEEVTTLVTTLSLGESSVRQTEALPDMGSQTIYLRIDEPGAAVLHTEWSPTEPQLLLTAGQSLLRVHHIPAWSPPRADATSKPTSRDLELGLNCPTVTAVAWTLPGEALIGTLESMTTDGGETITKGKLFHLGGGGLQIRLVSSLLSPVVALRYNASANLLLSVCTTGDNSCIYVWKEIKREPLYTTQTSKAIYAAEWISDSTFVVAGPQIVQVYEMTPERGLVVSTTFPTAIRWESVCYDPVCSIIACSGVAYQELASGNGSAPCRPTLGLILSNDDSIHTNELGLDEAITGLQFQPAANPVAHRADSHRLLATSSDTGIYTIKLWNANKPFQLVHKIFSGSVIEIAFSPDGRLLAAARTDTVTFWDPETAVSKATWKPAAGDESKWDTTLPDSCDTELDHLLRWDADGKKLAYTLGNQVAIINCSLASPTALK